MHIHENRMLASMPNLVRRAYVHSNTNLVYTFLLDPITQKGKEKNLAFLTKLRENFKNENVCNRFVKNVRIFFNDNTH